MSIKVIAFDVYGTILCSIDPENCMPPRKGFLEFARKCIADGIVLVTSSDSSTDLLKIDLEESGVPLEIFTDFYPMEKLQPKYFDPILDFFGIKPCELYVFGNVFELDIEPALKLGCGAKLVPSYDSGKDDFDWTLVSF